VKGPVSNLYAREEKLGKRGGGVAERERGHKHPPSLLLLVIVAIGVHPAGARLPPIRNLFTQALGLPCWALVLSFYEWSSKLAVRVTSGQVVLTTSERVERLLEAGAVAAMETAQVASFTSGQAAVYFTRHLIG